MLQGVALLSINGGPVTPASPDARSWITAAGTWRSGDLIELRLPMELRLAPFTAGHDHPTAIAYGPAAVAVYAGRNDPVADRSAERCSRVYAATRVGRRIGMAGPEVAARPYYAVPRDQKYHVYRDSAVGAYIELTGRWRANESQNFTRTAGASASCEFEGTGVRFLWREFDDAGIARIEIDGAVVAELDQYGPARGVDTFSDFDGLRRGLHQNRVTCTGEKRPESRSAFINVVTFKARH